MYMNLSIADECALRCAQWRDKNKKKHNLNYDYLVWLAGIFLLYLPCFAYNNDDKLL